MLNDLINETAFLGLRGRHVIITLRIALSHLNGPAYVDYQDII